ncbi:MAG: NAD(P)/FAD-dependent oxidoreductase, partial [Gammaproteobacteria bacterium]
NRYPGAQCDTEAYIYLPLLEETGYIPTERYAYRPEIFAHMQRIGRHFELYDRALFQTQMQSARWSESDGRWTVTTDREDVIKARFVIVSSGPINRPKLPAIPGITTFKGRAFHTSRWDYDYTGGDSTGGLTGLADKRVGVVGTGATGVQVVPVAAEYAGHLYLFQRTPASVDERNNRPTDPAWANSLTPGWQEARDENFCAIMAGLEVEQDLVNDKWTDFFKLTYKILDTDGNADPSDERKALAREIADYQKGNEIRARVARVVADPRTAEALKPWYGQWCKRPNFHDEYLAAFNRPNVELVDTEGKGIERITENAVVVGGVAYDVDCLIFATGFEAATSYTRRSECEIYGRGGVPLSRHWSDGMRTFHGFLTHGFPNCLHMGLTQSGLAFNYTYAVNGQSKHVAYLVSTVLERGARSIEPTVAAEAAYVELVSAPGPMHKYQATCTPGYYNVEGKNTGQGFLDNQYPEGAVPFFRMLAAWREEGNLAGMIVE